MKSIESLRSLLLCCVLVALPVYGASAQDGDAPEPQEEGSTEQAQQEVYKGFIDNPSIIQSLYKPEPLDETEWIRLSGWLLALLFIHVLFAALWLVRLEVLELS